QNAMIVDSSALPEQVVADVLTSADLRLRQRRATLLGVAAAISATGHRRPDHPDAGGGNGRTADRRPGAARNRYRPGDRRRGPPGAATPRRADEPRGAPGLPMRPAVWERARQLLRARSVRDRQR